MKEADMEVITSLMPGAILQEEGLKLSEQQYVFSDRSRADLIFTDAKGRKLVVELKSRPLIEADIAQVQGYRKWLGGTGVRAMLLAPFPTPDHVKTQADAVDVETRYVDGTVFVEEARKEGIKFTETGDISPMDTKTLQQRVEGTIITESGPLGSMHGLGKPAVTDYAAVARSVLSILHKRRPDFVGEYYWQGIAHPKDKPVEWLAFYLPQFGVYRKAITRPAFFNIAWDGRKPRKSSNKPSDWECSKFDCKVWCRDSVRGMHIVHALSKGPKAPELQKRFIIALNAAAESLSQRLPDYPMRLYFNQRKNKGGQPFEDSVELPASPERIHKFFDYVSGSFTRAKPDQFSVYMKPTHDAFSSPGRLAREFAAFVEAIMPVHELFYEVFAAVYEVPRDD